MKNQVFVDGSGAYIAAIQRWVAKFSELMRTEMYAPIAILAYYLPHQCTMVGCPLGDKEYQNLGEQMRLRKQVLWLKASILFFMQRWTIAAVGPT